MTGYGVMLVLKHKVWFYKVQDVAQYPMEPRGGSHIVFGLCKT